MATTTRHVTSADFRTRHEHIVIGGMRLHWAELGEASDAVPIVLLHGINDSHRTWKRVAPLISSHRRVLMPDFFGCGLSERPDASYELGWHARAIDEWLSRLDVPIADFVGHSFGGGVAQMLLFERPERIRRLALVASGGLGRDVGPWLRLAAATSQVVELLGQPFMALGTRLALRSAPLSWREVTKLSAMNGADGTARAFARTLQDVISWRGQRRLFLEHVHEVRALPPIAVYWGDRDALIPMHHGEALARAVEGVTFRPFLGCGHYLHHERPEAFASALREFLDAPGVEPARASATYCDRPSAPSQALAWLPSLARLEAS